MHAVGGAGGAVGAGCVRGAGCERSRRRGRQALMRKRNRQERVYNARLRQRGRRPTENGRSGGDGLFPEKIVAFAP